jgi:iron complex transport system substrate-binding protein
VIARVLASLLVLVFACGPRERATTSGRVVSQVVFADEELWAFGPEVHARVVGVSSLADDRRYSGVPDAWPPSVPRVAGVEDIAALAPDLVITAEFTAAETRAMLEQLGVRTLDLAGWQGFADYRKHTAALAAAVDAVEQGSARIAAFDQTLASLSIAPTGDRRPTIVSWQDGMIAGGGTSFADAAHAAGFANLPQARGIDGHAEVGVESLVAWDPEVIVVPCEPGECETRAQAIAQQPGIRATQAARGGHVVAIPSHHLYSTGFGMLELVRALAEVRRSLP